MDKAISEKADDMKAIFSELFANIPAEAYDILFPKIKKRYFCKVQPDYIIIPKGVTRIDYYAFKDCGYIQKITVPEGVTTIESEAFSGCSGIIDITIPNTVTKIGSYAFYECTSLEKVTLSDNIEVIEHSCFRGCSKLDSLPQPNGLKKIERCAFSGCCFKHITINEGVTEIAGNAFEGNWNSLEYVSLPSTLQTIGCAVFNCCRKLKEIKVSPNSKYFISVDGVLFSRDLKTLYAYPADKPDKTYHIPPKTKCIIDYAFFDAHNLDTVYLSNVKEIGEFSFYGSSVKAIILPSSTQRLGTYCFAACRRLLSVTVSGNLHTIPKHCFCSCNSLCDIDIKNGVKVIEDDAFSACKSLHKFIMPSSVSEVGEKMLDGCDNLEMIIISSAVKVIPKDFFTFSRTRGKRFIQIPDVAQIDDAAVSGTKSEVSIICKYGSKAYQYAVKNGFDVITV